MAKVNKYVVAEDYREEVLELLKSKGTSARAIGQLIFERAPRSLVRWSTYLTIDEMDRYLVPVGEDNVNESQMEISDFGI